jgi:hypothetical protein
MTTPTRLERRDAPPLRQANLEQLEPLGRLLSQRGLRADVIAAEARMPRLHVTNPAVTGLEEDVYAWRCQDGSWWFWWSWAERIAPGTDPGRAADRIEHVLAAQLDGLAAEA